MKRRIIRSTLRTSLVIIDLIEDYFDPAIWPDSRIPGRRTELVDKTNQLVRLCRASGVPVMWIRQEFRTDGSDVFPHMRKRAQSYAIAGTPGSELLHELEVASHDRVLAKHRFSAFFETALASTLGDAQIDTVILAGITTAWCIRSTATDAYQMNLDVVLASDCTDGFTVADHDTAIEAMDGYIARALSNEEISEWLQRV